MVTSGDDYGGVVSFWQVGQVMKHFWFVAYLKKQLVVYSCF